MRRRRAPWSALDSPATGRSGQGGPGARGRGGLREAGAGGRWPRSPCQVSLVRAGVSMVGASERPATCPPARGERGPAPSGRGGRSRRIGSGLASLVPMVGDGDGVKRKRPSVVRDARWPAPLPWTGVPVRRAEGMSSSGSASDSGSSRSSPSPDGAVENARAPLRALNPLDVDMDNNRDELPLWQGRANAIPILLVLPTEIVLKDLHMRAMGGAP